MSIVKRPYTSQPGFTEDFNKVRDFLVRINNVHVTTPGFLWGRWEWGFSLPYLDVTSLTRMGVWEDGGEIVALAAYEQGLGYAWLCLDEKYGMLTPELLAHARDGMMKDGTVKALIPDTDRELQRAAFEMGFRPTQEKECNAALDINRDSLRYTLPEGFRITSLAEECDLRKYNRVLWKGFNHGDDVPETEEQLENRRVSLSGPHVDLNLNIAVAAPDGEFVSYCGMWHESGTDYALVEPVATDPAYRKMGLGRAAVLEAIKRCGERGAKRAFVGSSQQFYYSIGFYPYSTETFWECKA
jgi:GNAT superfamily N-acetyltransferase